MTENRPTVSSSSAATLVPPPSTTDPYLISARKTTDFEQESLSGYDHPELTKVRGHRRSKETEDISRSTPPSHSDADMLAKQKIQEWMNNRPPRSTRKLTEAQHRGMEQAITKLNQAVADGNAEVRIFSATSLMPAECGCASSGNGDE
jgi:hypothetical protein